MDIITAILVLPLLLQATAPAEEGLDQLLDSISERMKSHPEYESFSASVVATETRMNGNWEPERSDVVRKRIVQRGEERSEDILEATRTEKGTTRDITEEYRKKREKRRRKQEAKGADPEHETATGEFSLSGSEMFPFAPERRALYTISRLADTALEDRPVIVLRSEALNPSKDLLEGTYHLDAETLDVLEVDLVPSKNPRFVKELNMQMSFTVLPGDYFVIERMRMKIRAGFLFKKVRMLVEEHYQDHRIPAEDEQRADSR